MVWAENQEKKEIHNTLLLKKSLNAVMISSNLLPAFQKLDGVFPQPIAIRKDG